MYACILHIYIYIYIYIYIGDTLMVSCLLKFVSKVLPHPRQIVNCCATTSSALACLWRQVYGGKHLGARCTYRLSGQAKKNFSISHIWTHIFEFLSVSHHLPSNRSHADSVLYMIQSKRKRERERASNREREIFSVSWRMRSARGGGGKEGEKREIDRASKQASESESESESER